MTDQITAIVVDDEESARDILCNLLERFCPQINVLDNFSNVEDAVEGIKALNPSVVFLDIEMPNYAGYEIVDFFDEVPFDIVFITAYDKYAIKAFEVAAVDYLLKPIDISRLKQAVEKLTERAQNRTSKDQLSLLSTTLKTDEITKIAVIEKGYRKYIDLAQISAIEAQESYCKIYMQSGEHHLVSNNLKHYENLFENAPHFYRCHKSWIVNLNRIENYSKSKLAINMDNSITAKLSKYRKRDFEALLIKSA